MSMHKEILGVWGQRLLLFLLFVQQNSESQYFFLRFTYYLCSVLPACHKKEPDFIVDACGLPCGCWN